MSLLSILLSVWGDALEHGRELFILRVVEDGFDLSAAVAAFLEVDLQQILQALLLHDGRDSCQQQRPRTLRHLGLEKGGNATQDRRVL